MCGDYTAINWTVLYVSRCSMYYTVLTYRSIDAQLQSCPPPLNLSITRDTGGHDKSCGVFNSAKRGMSSRCFQVHWFYMTDDL